MKNFNEKTMTILTKAMEMDKPFYASDLGVKETGGNISALVRAKLLRETGNTKSVMVNIYDEMYKKCEVKEWKVNKKAFKALYKDTCKEMETIFLFKTALEKLL